MAPLVGMQHVAGVRQGMHAVLRQDNANASRDLQGASMLQPQDAAALKVQTWRCTIAAISMKLLQQLHPHTAAAKAAPVVLRS